MAWRASVEKRENGRRGWGGMRGYCDQSSARNNYVQDKGNTTASSTLPSSAFFNL